MKPYGSSGPTWRGPISLLVLSVVFLVVMPSRAAHKPAKKVEVLQQQITHYHLDDPHTKAGFEHFYNSEYDPAIKEFEITLQSRPDDPFAVNHLLTGVMFKEMYRVGAL